MFDNFDDFESLFEKYFGKSKPSEVDSDELDSFIEMIEKLNGLTDSFNLTDGGFDPDEDDLGEPDDIIFFEENGFSFKIVKVEMLSTPIDKPNISYKEQLNIAIDSEKYEEAARLRDKINTGKHKNL